MPYNQLTSPEVHMISEMLRSECVVIEKLGAYAGQCNDPEVRRQCQDNQNVHLRHYERLLRTLNNAVQAQGTQTGAYGITGQQYEGPTAYGTTFGTAGPAGRGGNTETFNFPRGVR